jgi:hypothetical protein
MYSDNNWYGHRFIYQQYCKLDKDLPIFGSLQHGCHRDGFVESFQDIGVRKFSQFIPHFCWDQKTENLLKKRGIKNVHSIGAPFIYLMKIINIKINVYETNKKNGTLYFHGHTTHEEFLKENRLDYIVKKIENNNNGPFTVCLYYADCTEHNITYFKRRKWNIVCCGSRDDNFTLFKIFNLINDNQKCIFNTIGSSLFYSMFQKKKTQIIQGLISRENKSYSDTLQLNIHRKKFPSLFKNHIDIDLGYEYAKKYLGFSSLKDPEELKDILGWNSFLKKNISFIFCKLNDLKYSKKLRQGKKIKEKYRRKLKNSF